MKFLASKTYSIPILLFPSSAFAEVCDKEVPSWNHTSGPVSSLEYFLSATISPLGLTILSLLILSFILRKLWLSILGGLLTFLVLLGPFSLLSDSIFVASIREGCRASPLWVLVTLTGVALTFAVLTLRSWKAKPPS